MLAHHHKYSIFVAQTKAQTAQPEFQLLGIPLSFQVQVFVDLSYRVDLLTLCILINSSILLETMSLGWFIVSIKGSQVGISRLKYNSVYEDYSKTCLKRPLKKKTKDWFSRPIIT